MLRVRRLFGNERDRLPHVDPVQVWSYEETCRDLGQQLNWHLERRKELNVEVAKSFIPCIIRRPHLCRQEETVMLRSVGCVVSFVAGGVSTLNEKLAPRADGAEAMSRSLNRFFTPLIDIIEAYRGDIIKFGGEVLSIFFEATDDYKLHDHPCGSFQLQRKTPLQLACLRASACSLEVQKKLDSFDTGEHAGVKLRIQTSIGAGSVVLLQVGGGHGLDRFEFIIAGPPMQQISTAIKWSSPGDMIISPEAWAEVEFAAVEGAPLTDAPNGYRRLAGLNTMYYTYPTVKQAAVECTKQEAQREREKMASQKEKPMAAADALKNFMRFLPRAVFKHLRSGNTSSINEVRLVTIIMCQVNGVDVFTDAGAQAAQKLMANMQRAFYCNEGNLNKFTVDDRSMVFTIVFGLPPLVHIDDPQRAISTCFDSNGVLKEMGLSGQFGICTGRVFCGIIGSAKRREYTVLGDTHKRTKWLMSQAATGTILIDEATYARVNKEVPCRRLPPLKDLTSGTDLKVFAPMLPVVCGIEVGQFSAVTHHRTWFVRKTKIDVHLEDGKRMPAHIPWKASSRLLGGSCPLLQLTRWRELQKIDALLQQEEGGILEAGGALVLHGPSGIGKQELSEYLVHRGSLVGIVPVFGTMHRRQNQQWRAVIELVQNCLHILSQDEVSLTCAKNNTVSDFPSAGRDSADPVDAVIRKLFMNTDRDHLHSALLFLGFDTFKADKAYGDEKCAQPLNIMDSRDSVRSVLSRVSASNRAVNEAEYPDEELAEDTAEVATVLVEAVSERYGVCVVLRIRHGTDIKDSLGEKSSSFWELSSQLCELAMRRQLQIVGGSRLKPIICVTTSRKFPGFGQGMKPTMTTRTRASKPIGTRKSSFWDKMRASTSEVTDTDLPQSKQSKRSGESSFTAMSSMKTRASFKLSHPVSVAQKEPDSRGAETGPLFTGQESEASRTLTARSNPTPGSLDREISPTPPDTPSKRMSFWGRKTTKAARPDEKRNSETDWNYLGKQTPYEMEMRPLTEDAAVEFMCLCLGLQTTGGGSLVGRKLREFVSAVSINIPTYIQECLEQLNCEGYLKIAGGECAIDAEDIDAINIADWVNTIVVGGAISQLESLGPAKHHIMKVATILKNPFSPLDLVAVNRTLFGQVPKILSFHDQVKLLVACQELCAMGLLRKVWFPGSTSQPPDCAPAAIPRYTISNFLFRKVTRSMVPKSEALFFKRAVLINRFIYRGLWLELPRRLLKSDIVDVHQGHGGKLGSDKKQGPSSTVRPWWVFTYMGATRADQSEIDKENISTEESIERPRLTGIPFLSVRRAASQKPPNMQEINDMLTAACCIGNIAVVREILNYHQGLVDLNLGDMNGYTPMHFAASSGHRDIVELLFRSKATLNAKSNMYETPMLVAAQRGHLKVVQYFMTRHPECATGRENVFTYWEGQLPDLDTVNDIPPPLSPGFQEAEVIVDDLNRRREEVKNFFDNSIEKLFMEGPYISSKNSQQTSMPAQEPVYTSKSSERQFKYRQFSIYHAVRASLVSPAGAATAPVRFTRVSNFATTMSRASVAIKNGIQRHTRGFSVFQPTASAGRRRTKIRTRIPIARVRAFIYSREAIGFMLLVVITALYLPDIWVSIGAESDVIKDVLMTCVTLLFVLELFAICIVDSSYPFSIFFYTDCIGTVSILWDISYIFGQSAAETREIDASERDLTFFRALRSGKLGARASRLSRIVKVMRFLPGLNLARKDEGIEEDEKEQLKQISKQLTNVLSTRVSCSTVLLIICTPLFAIGLYPETDQGMRVWVDALSRHVQFVLDRGAPLNGIFQEASMESMLDSFARFYQAKSYGPFQFCANQACEELPTPFEQPGRRSFQLDVKTELIVCHFDISNVLRAEADMNLILITAAIVVMCTTCLLLNYTAAELAIRPLERMMASIKASAQSIFKSTIGEGDDEETEEFWEHKQSELETLERVVRKVANLAVASKKKDPFAGVITLSRMRTEDYGVLEMTKEWWKQGGTRRSDDDFNVFTDGKGEGQNTDTMMARQWRLEELGFVYEVVNSWYFNPLELTSDKLEQISAWLIVNNPGSSDYTERQVDAKKLHKFISCCCDGYGRSPYHNFMHAVDVTHAVYQFGTLMHAERIFSNSNQFSLLIAALAHDIGHFGLNNSFLIETQSDLAIRYNDRSPLENMHCCKLFEILSVESTNICASMSSEDFKDARKLIIDAILHTDMFYHPGMLRELDLLYEMNSKIFDSSTSVELTDAQVEVFKSGDTKKLMSKMLLHGSDLSNPAKPWSLAYDWAYRVLDEYFEQGDKEKELGIPVSMLNDRERVNRPNSQVGFIEFVVAPLLAAQVKLVHAWYESAVTLEANLQNWQRTWNFESHPDEAEKEKVRARVAKVGGMLAFASNIQGSGGPQFGHSTTQRQDSDALAMDRLGSMIQGNREVKIASKKSRA